MKVTLTKLRKLAADRGYDDVTVERSRLGKEDPIPWICTVHTPSCDPVNAYVVSVAGTSRDKVIRAAYAAMKELGRTK